jgi:hypothetical protein
LEFIISVLSIVPQQSKIKIILLLFAEGEEKSERQAEGRDD